MDEQRGVPRWRIKEAMKVLFEEKFQFDDCMVEDMNLKGMRVSLPARLPQHSFARLGLELSRDTSVVVDVYILWVKEEGGRYTHGFEFNRMKDEDKDKIYQYINDHCMKQLEARWWQGARVAR